MTEARKKELLKIDNELSNLLDKIEVIIEEEQKQFGNASIQFQSGTNNVIIESLGSGNKIVRQCILLD